MDLTLKEAKAGFFDRAAVAQDVEQLTRRALSKFGAFVRRRARSSIKKAPWVNDRGEAVRGKKQREAQKARPATAKPGSPPYSHAGDLRRLIVFAYDPERRGVVIGPTKFKKGEVPRLLEHGGTVTRPGKNGPRTLHYRGNPFMKPAGDAELARFKQLVKDNVR